MALNKTDLKEIGKILDSKLGLQDKNFDKKLDNQRKKINQDIGNLISDQILPQFDSLNDQFEGVNRKLDSLFDRGDRHSKQLENHEKRITKLEKVSPIIP